jgi:hypothetical protein
MKKKPTTTTLGEKLRELATQRPERAFELRRQADAFDAASEGYFFAGAPTVTANGFMAAWTQARALYEDLSEPASA